MFRSRRYRHNNEHVILFSTLLLVLVVVVFTSTVTFCLSGVLVIALFALSAFMIRSHHQSLMQSAFRVNPVSAPDLAEVVGECALKIQPGQVDVFLAEIKQMNAYTFGISSPKVLVLYSPLLRVMSAGELKFIIGHEMGHVALGHTWLNTIVGGLAGIPAPFGAAVLLYAAFRWWNRICEFSADRAGLLACGELDLAISSLVKLVAPEIRSQEEFEQALALIGAQDDAVSDRVAQAFQTHPMLIRRIDKLKDYARTPEYQWLQAGVNHNLGEKPGTTAERVAPLPPPPIAPTVAQTPEKSAEERWPWLKRKQEPGDSQREG